MANSAFNISGCSGTGGSGGNSGSCSGWTEIAEKDGQDITVVSDDKLKTALRKIWEENPQSHTNQVADMVWLKYDCPKAGDAIFWNAQKAAYDLASAEIDDANLTDPEHQIESVGIVEEVMVTCSENELIPDEGYQAKVVFFGKITFPEYATTLEPGQVYYLSDFHRASLAPSEKRVGNNAVHAAYEPVISKPLFVATGTHTAIVTNYRPLTGSPTGGVPATEEYTMTVVPQEFIDSNGDLIDVGWKITVENTGQVASRNQLFIQMEYNKLEGPQEIQSGVNMLGDETYVTFEDIGILYTKAQDNITTDPTIRSSYSYTFADHNNTPNMTGIGEITARLKIFTQSTSNINFADRVSSPEVALSNSDESQSSILKPTLQITGTCEGEDPDIENEFYDPDGIVPSSTVVYEEGAVFELALDPSYPLKTENADGVAIKVPMKDDSLGFVIESIDTDGEVDTNWNSILGAFGLNSTDKQAVEIIPMTASEQTVTDRQVRIRLVKPNGSELHTNHWAHEYSAGQENITCASNECCGGDQMATLTHQGENPISITEILGIASDGVAGDSTLLNNLQSAQFFTKGINAPSYRHDALDMSQIALSWKNMREDTVFCYPKVAPGGQPSTMTIYANEAREFSPEDLAKHTPTGHGAELYDPRYTIMEIGAQDTLEGHMVRVTVNSGQRGERKEMCFSGAFLGTLAGSHYTIEELLSAKMNDNQWVDKEITSLSPSSE